MKVKVKSLSHVRLFGTHGLQPTRLLRPWDFPGKNTGVGCHFLLQEIFPTQGLNPSLPHCWLTLYLLSHQGSPEFLNYWWYSQIYSFYAFEFVSFKAFPLQGYFFFNSLIFPYNIFNVLLLCFPFIPRGIYCESCIPVSIPPQFGVHPHHSPDTGLGKVSRDFCAAGINAPQLGGLKQKKLICSQSWGPEILNQVSYSWEIGVRKGPTASRKIPWFLPSKLNLYNKIPFCNNKLLYKDKDWRKYLSPRAIQWSS